MCTHVSISQGNDEDGGEMEELSDAVIPHGKADDDEGAHVRLSAIFKQYQSVLDIFLGQKVVMCTLSLCANEHLHDCTFTLAMHCCDYSCPHMRTSSPRGLKVLQPNWT